MDFSEKMKQANSHEKNATLLSQIIKILKEAENGINKTILMHISVEVVKDWPNPTPLNQGEQR